MAAAASTCWRPIEPGLGGFQIHLWDAMGGNGDFTGQMTYDMFNQPLTNSLAGTIDPDHGNNACPIIDLKRHECRSDDMRRRPASPGMIVTCPKYEVGRRHASPLAGQAVIANLMPGRCGVQLPRRAPTASPAAKSGCRPTRWTARRRTTSFTRIGEPSYFQEFGPAAYHVSIGFANPAIINARKPYVCNGTDPNLHGAG